MSDAPPRRRVLKWLGFGLSGLAAAAAAVPVVGAFLSPVLEWAPDEWVRLGRLQDFPLRATKLIWFLDPHRQKWDGLSARTSAYVRREEDRVVVFSVHCAHLGCPVTWFPQSGLFMCPCHGGVYDAEGEHVSGPPPRGLFRYQHKIEDGDLYVLAGHLPTLSDPLSPNGAEEDRS